MKLLKITAVTKLDIIHRFFGRNLLEFIQVRLIITHIDLNDKKELLLTRRNMTYLLCRVFDHGGSRV